MLPAAEVIRHATANCAQLFELDIGVVEAGRLADLLLVDGNPLEDISVLVEGSRIRAVMKEGIFVASDGSIDLRAAGTVVGHPPPHHGTPRVSTA